MKTRTLLMLVILLAILASIVFWLRKTPAVSRPDDSMAIDETVLPDLDVNAVSRIDVYLNGSSAVVSRVAGRWTVATSQGYPADFDRVAETLTKLYELRVGQVVRSGEKYLEEFGLATVSNRPAPTSITLSDEAGRELARLYIGRPHHRGGTEMSGMPDGQYMRAGDGPVIITKEFFDALPAQSQEWLRRRLIQLAPNAVSEVRVRNAEGAAYTLTATTNGVFSMKGLAEGETVKQDEARRVARTLENLEMIRIAEPFITRADAGLEKPAEYMARTSEGLVYTVRIGARLDAGDGQYATLSVAYEPPPAPEGATNTTAAADAALARQATEDNEFFSRWIYVLRQYDVGNMTMAREALVLSLTGATNAPPAQPSAESEDAPAAVETPPPLPEE